MSQPGHVSTTFYVQIKPEFSYDGSRVYGAKAVAVTQGKPERQRGGTVVVKLTVQIPPGAFMPLAPEAVIVIPESMAVASPIEVAAEDPS